MNITERAARCVRVGACLTIAVTAAAGAWGVGRAAAQDGPPGRYVDLVFESVTRTNALKYGSAVDKPSGRTVDLLLDLYEPAGDTAARRPVFVFLFGGAFVAGDRQREPQAYCEQMARRGYVAAAIDYRIKQGNIVEDGNPAAVSDARQAVRWLRAHADAHRLDVNRVVIGGSSAGAITSLLVAYSELERGEGDGPPDVAAVVDLWGGLFTMVGEMTSGEPPLAIIHGTADDVVPFREAEKLRDRAAEVGIAYLFHPLADAGHAPYMPVELMAVVAPFLFEQLWGGGTAPTPTASAPPETTVPVPTLAPTTASPPVTTVPVPTVTMTPLPEAGRLYLPALWGRAGGEAP